MFDFECLTQLKLDLAVIWWSIVHVIDFIESFRLETTFKNWVQPLTQSTIKPCPHVIYILFKYLQR